MGKFLPLFLLATAFSGLSAASVCTDGSLASYIALGPAGCTIGGNTVGSFETLPGLSGALAISPGDVSVHPSGGDFNPSLGFSVDQTAGANSQLELLFSYLIFGGWYAGDSIALAGSSESGDGAVTDIQNFCAGGVAAGGITGCTGFAGSLLTLDGEQNRDSTTFGRTFFDVFVTDDFTLDGGLSGTASGGSITDRFSAVPEPFTYLLTGLGLAVGIGVKLVRRNRRRL